MLVEVKLGDGTTIGVPQTGELTMGEWRTVKERTGLTMLGFEEAIKDTDPDAWETLIWLGAARTGPPDQAALDAINFMELLEAITAAVEDEAEAASPPPEAADEAAGSQVPETILDGVGSRR